MVMMTIFPTDCLQQVCKASMELQGSCHCRRIYFSVISHTPQPFMYCYCSICRKTQGGSGAAINIMGDYRTLIIQQGEQYLKMYQAVQNYEEPLEKRHLVGNHRYFCQECGSYLYAYNPKYPDNVYPYASAIDTPLPKAVEAVHIMQDFKANWVPVPQSTSEVASKVYARYPDIGGIEIWHKKNGQYID